MKVLVISASCEGAALTVNATLKTAPTQEPTADPTIEPTGEPLEEPTAEPVEEPSEEPTEKPIEEPTDVPTEEPTEVPTTEPTLVPTVVPTTEPTPVPTAAPTASPVPTATPVNVEGMKMLKIGDGVKCIESEAFAGTGAEVIYLPAGIISIANDAFDNCPNLKYILNASDLMIEAPANVMVLTSWIMTSETLEPAATETPAPETTSGMTMSDYIGTWIPNTVIIYGSVDRSETADEDVFVVVEENRITLQTYIIGNSGFSAKCVNGALIGDDTEGTIEGVLQDDGHLKLTISRPGIVEILIMHKTV